MPQIVLHQHLDNKWVERVVNWGGKHTYTCPHTVLSIIDVLPLLTFPFLFSTLFRNINHENLKMIKTDQKKTKSSCIFEWPESAYEGLVNCVYRKYILQMHKYLPQFIIYLHIFEHTEKKSLVSTHRHFIWKNRLRA